MAHFIPLKNRQEHTLAIAFIREIWRLHGLPTGVVSDRDTVFTSKLWSEGMRLLDVSQDMSTAYHQQTDRQTKRVNEVVEQYLRIYCSWDQKNWMELLPDAEFCYNNTVHSSTKMTPFYTALGYHPGNNYPAVDVISDVPVAEEYILKLKKLREDMRDTLILARQRMAKFYNRKISEQEPGFNIDDWVMLNVKDFKKLRPSKKLDHKMRGKFKVKRLIGSHAYELEFPPNVGKHPVFHVSILEPYNVNPIPGRRSPTSPSELDLDGEATWEVEEVLASQTRYRKVEYLIKWKGYGCEKNTCEPYDSLLGGAQESVKDFHLKNQGMPKDPRVLF